MEKGKELCVRDGESPDAWIVSRVWWLTVGVGLGAQTPEFFCGVGKLKLVAGLF